MSTASSWQKWASDQQRKDLFVVSTTHSPTNVPTPKPPAQLPTPPARAIGQSQLETKTTVLIPPQTPPPQIVSISKTNNQLKIETSTSHHTPATAAPRRFIPASPPPSNKRPETTDVVARRLIGRALGINLAKREGEGEGERFGKYTKKQTQTGNAAELELVKKMDEVEISPASER